MLPWPALCGFLCVFDVAVAVSRQVMHEQMECSCCQMHADRSGLDFCLRTYFKHYRFGRMLAQRHYGRMLDLQMEVGAAFRFCF